MSDIESIVNELVEKRIKEKIAVFLDGKFNEYNNCEYNGLIDEKIKEKISEIIAVYLDKNKTQLERKLNEIIAERINIYKHTYIKCDFSISKY